MYIIYGHYHDFEMYYSGTGSKKGMFWEEDISKSTAFESEQTPERILLTIDRDYTKPTCYYVVWIDSKKKRGNHPPPP